MSNIPSNYKLQTVKTFLERYSVVKQNNESLRELNEMASEGINNPSIGGRGYHSGGNGSEKSDRSSSAVVRADTVNTYVKNMTEKNNATMREIENAIGLLDVCRGKTIVELRFLAALPWEQICSIVDRERDYCYKLYRAAMLQLYDLMIANGIIDGEEYPKH